MGWTADRWPLGGKLSTPTNLLTCANELRTECNRRVGGTPVAAFSTGKSLWNALAELRTKVDEGLATGNFYDRVTATGLPLVSPGVAADATHENVWTTLYAGGRDAWRNLLGGTEAVTPYWYPIDRSDPQKFLLNELYSVIDRLAKQAICPCTADAGLWKLLSGYDYGTGPDQMGYFASNDIWRAVMQFDLSGVTSPEDIAAAKLVCTWGDHGVYSIPNIRLARLLRAWSEGAHNGTAADAGDVTWASAQHGSVAWTTGGADSQGNDRAAFLTAQDVSAEGELELDILSIVQSWLLSSEPNYGILLACETESGATQYLINAATRHGAEATRPRLRILYA